jgi:hypothetical protein
MRVGDIRPNGLSADDDWFWVTAEYLQPGQTQMLTGIPMTVEAVNVAGRHVVAHYDDGSIRLWGIATSLAVLAGPSPEGLTP